MAAAAALPTSNPWSTQAAPYTSPYAGQPMGPTNSMPIAPTYNPTWNSGMAESPQIAGMLDAVPYNTQPLTNMENYASNPNASPWAQNATLESYLQQKQGQDALKGANAGGVAQTDSTLAMNGGLSSGARERASETGQASLMSGEQGLASTGQTNRTQIGINDAQNKLQAQEALPGEETQAYQAELEPIQMYGQAYGQDVANYMNSMQGQNQYNNQLYQTQGQMYGANQTANATQNAPTPSCWLITRMAKEGLKIPNDEAELLTRFKWYFAKYDPKYALFYINKCGQLVKEMDRVEFKWKGLYWFNDALMSMLRAGELDCACRLFIATVTDLCEWYWPHCKERQLKRLLEERARKIQVMASLEAPKGFMNKLAVKCLQNLERGQGVCLD